MVSVVEWAVASRPLGAEGESGDACLVREMPSVAMVAVVDGLGHGAAAAEVARHALAALAALPDGEHEPTAMLERCHEVLRSTRGAVLHVAFFDASQNLLNWAAVGTIQGALLRADPTAAPSERLLSSQGGVVGRQLPALKREAFDVAPGDTLVLATDGIRHAFSRGLAAAGPLQAKVDRILAEHWNGTDDALVVAVRYRGLS